METTFKNHQKFPENFDKYNDEWRIFWSAKYKELVSRGKDPDKFDYTPEWIDFWNGRIQELHENEKKLLKESLRKKFGLSRSAVENFKRRNSSTYETVDISDDETENLRTKRFRSDFLHNHEQKSFDYDCNSLKLKVDEGKVNLMSVCRLLSALETELGLLAPSVLDLLGKAVAVERNKPNSCDDLLFCEENCNVLETVKEKLKGTLSANIIAHNRVSAIKLAIQNIAKLMHSANLRKQEILSLKAEERKFENAKQIEVSLDDVVDPVAEARVQVATAIIDNMKQLGYSNLTAQELESLVDDFIKSQNCQGEEEISEKETENGSEDLTDCDIKTLLINFNGLSCDEQENLLAYLTKIEEKEPQRAEQLRKFKNATDEENKIERGKET